MKKLQITFMTASLFCMLLFFQTSTCTARTKPVFAQKYSSLTPGEKASFHVRSLVKGEFVRYAISDKSLASINKKTGKLLALKKGTVTVYAKIYNRNKKHIFTIKNKISIHTKNFHLSNASFQIKKKLNPWNFTLSLSCSRILLRKEIQNSKITIYPKKKTNKKVTASFSRLSSDGKTVFYTFSPTEQKKLCPGDSSMNGTYYLTSTHFSKKLSFFYQERIAKQSLSGFVFYSNGNPVAKALVSLKTEKSVRKAKTDNFGHYCIRKIKKADSLTVSKKGCIDAVISQPVISEKGTICENVILHSKKDVSASASFLVTDTQNTPVANASVSLIRQSKRVTKNTACMDNIPKECIVYSGTTDSNGKIIFANTEHSTSSTCGYTCITTDENTHIAYSKEKQASAKNTILLSESQFSALDRYAVYIEKESEAASYLSQKVTFSLKEMLNNHAFFHIRLSENPDLTIPSLCLQPTRQSSQISVEKASFLFYNPTQKSILYEKVFDRNALIFQDSSLLTPSIKLPHFPQNSSCYLQIRLYDAASQLIEASPLLPLFQKNHTLTFQNSDNDTVISLLPTYYARFLICFSQMPDSANSISFCLSQKTGEAYCYTDTISIKTVKQISKTLYCANLIVPNLFLEKDYLLTTENTTVAIEPYTFTADVSHAYPTETEALSCITPLAKIFCIPLHTDKFIPLENGKAVPFYYHSLHEITMSQLRSCKTYPNSVLAFYDKNGILLYSLLTDPITAEDASVLSKKTYTSYDIYTNHYLLRTTQTAYQ